MITAATAVKTLILIRLISSTFLSFALAERGRPLSREKSYEESMGTMSSFSLATGRAQGRISCYFTHDWSSDEQQR
jgi:hypothetical protein